MKSTSIAWPISAATIAGARPEWSSSEDIQNALSEEALTTAVMARYASLSQMKRQLGSRVGRADQGLTTSVDSE